MDDIDLAQLSASARHTRETSRGWMLQRISRAMDVDMTQRLAGLDMTQQQFAVMMIVLEHEPLIQSRIGDYFGMPPYAISRAVDALEAHGHLARAPHPTSRRAVTISTTPAGRALAPQLFAIVQGLNADLLAPLTADEQAQFGAILQKLLPTRTPKP